MLGRRRTPVGVSVFRRPIRSAAVIDCGGLLRDALEQPAALRIVLITPQLIALIHLGQIVEIVIAVVCRLRQIARGILFVDRHQTAQAIADPLHFTVHLIGHRHAVATIGGLHGVAAGQRHCRGHSRL